VILRDIEAKVSIIFFVGLFFPIGLCFLILFHKINYLMMILFVPLFLFILSILFQKLVKIDILLIGLLEDYSKRERKKFDEFIFFLQNFAKNLKTNISPELAFVNTYTQNEESFILLKKRLSEQIAKLLNFNSSFRAILENLKINFNSIRYYIIINTLEKMVDQDAYLSSEKIIEILEILYKHKHLEEKLGIIIKGEKFKVLLFLFLLPIIIGAIGGMFPLVAMLSNNNNLNIEEASYAIGINAVEFMVIFFTLLSSNLITSYYFLKIIKFDNKILLIFLSNLTYTLIFIIS
jgi:hypothetical protein